MIGVESRRKRLSAVTIIAVAALAAVASACANTPTQRPPRSRRRSLTRPHFPPFDPHPILPGLDPRDV